MAYQQYPEHNEYAKKENDFAGAQGGGRSSSSESPRIDVCYDDAFGRFMRCKYCKKLFYANQAYRFDQDTICNCKKCGGRHTVSVEKLKKGKRFEISLLALVSVVSVLVMLIEIGAFRLLTDKWQVLKSELLENRHTQTSSQTAPAYDAPASENDNLSVLQDGSSDTMEIPAELSAYKDGLTEENRTYKVLLDPQSNMLYREVPEYIPFNKKPNNSLGKLSGGTRIYVEYIYDGLWAVFQKDGRYVFASLYNFNNPLKGRLLGLVD